VELKKTESRESGHALVLVLVCSYPVSASKQQRTRACVWAGGRSPEMDPTARRTEYGTVKNTLCSETARAKLDDRRLFFFLNFFIYLSRFSFETKYRQQIFDNECRIILRAWRRAATMSLLDGKLGTQSSREKNRARNENGDDGDPTSHLEAARRRWKSKLARATSLHLQLDRSARQLFDHTQLAPPRVHMIRNLIIMELKLYYEIT
jgi:hypothetical protein